MRAVRVMRCWRRWCGSGSALVVCCLEEEGRPGDAGGCGVFPNDARLQSHPHQRIGRWLTFGRFRIVARCVAVL
ncbi:acyl-CoA dehydrogenase domain-containing protein [Anopheles sinensis]|uniref:Acyl-CoA dehydrogenase domain-containing protein n=1 Tax=Anopheles sinensis TaxID=74873 RepID=A0A084WV27_ANOSI|nr:acyl-CoA dehydrogenase domain-containing protein [Anopheles sinensis]